MTRRHSSAWHRMHDAALTERAEIEAVLAVPTMLVMSASDRARFAPMLAAPIARLEPGPLAQLEQGLMDLDKHARRMARAAHGHQTGSYDD